MHVNHIRSKVADTCNKYKIRDRYEEHPKDWFMQKSDWTMITCYVYFFKEKFKFNTLITYLTGASHYRRDIFLEGKIVFFPLRPPHLYFILYLLPLYVSCLFSANIWAFKRKDSRMLYYLMPPNLWNSEQIEFSDSRISIQITSYRRCVSSETLQYEWIKSINRKKGMPLRSKTFLY